MSERIARWRVVFMRESPWSYGHAAQIRQQCDEERFLCVQAIFGLVEGIYRARSTHGNKILYTAAEIDFLAVYIASVKVWYIIPVDCAPASGVLAFYPSGRERGSGRFEEFREAWHLLAPGADLPQPRTLRHAGTPNLHGKRFVK